MGAEFLFFGLNDDVGFSISSEVESCDRSLKRTLKRIRIGWRGERFKRTQMESMTWNIAFSQIPGLFVVDFSSYSDNK